jgi:hypothetical protein
MFIESILLKMRFLIVNSVCMDNTKNKSINRKNVGPNHIFYHIYDVMWMKTLQL